MKKIKGYKIFNPDFTCRDFKYEVGKKYKHKGGISLCSSGFHFCIEIKHLYSYYNFDYKNIVCEIEASGEIKHSTEKSVTNTIKIIRIINVEELLEKLNLLCSSNKGSWNKGSWNEGSWNKGSSNEGSSNKGSRNEGSWNEGSYCNGFFNLNSFSGSLENCYVFDKKTNMSLKSFNEKNIDLLREFELRDFSNISKIRNFSKGKWEKIKNVI